MEKTVLEKVEVLNKKIQKINQERLKQESKMTYLQESLDEKVSGYEKEFGVKLKSKSMKTLEKKINQEQKKVEENLNEEISQAEKVISLIEEGNLSLARKELGIEEVVADFDNDENGSDADEILSDENVEKEVEKSENIDADFEDEGELDDDGEDIEFDVDDEDEEDESDEEEGEDEGESEKPEKKKLSIDDLSGIDELDYWVDSIISETKEKKLAKKEIKKENKIEDMFDEDDDFDFGDLINSKDLKLG